MIVAKPQLSYPSAILNDLKRGEHSVLVVINQASVHRSIPTHPTLNVVSKGHAPLSLQWRRPGNPPLSEHESKGAVHLYTHYICSRDGCMLFIVVSWLFLHRVNYGAWDQGPVSYELHRSQRALRKGLIFRRSFSMDQKPHWPQGQTTQNREENNNDS